MISTRKLIPELYWKLNKLSYEEKKSEFGIGSFIINYESEIKVLFT